MSLSSESKILITGGSGFVGQSILDYLKTSDHIYARKISVITNRSKPIIDPELSKKYDIELIKFDLKKEWNFPGAYTHLINLAGDGTHDPYSLDSGQSFLEIATNAAHWIKMSEVEVFHASSGAINGYVPLMRTLDQENKKSTFIKYRQLAESKLLEACENRNKLNIGRLYSFIGPNILKKQQYAISQFIEGALSNGVVEILGNPGTIRSYLWQGDMSAWILHSFDISSSSTLEIGSSNGASMFSLAEYVAKSLNATLRNPMVSLPGDIYVARNDDTLELLGVQESLAWRQQIDETIRIGQIGGRRDD